MQRVTVWIYKGTRRAETYLYVPEENNFEQVPQDLLTALGTLELVMELETRRRASPRPRRRERDPEGSFPGGLFPTARAHRAPRQAATTVADQTNFCRGSANSRRTMGSNVSNAKVS